MAYNPNNANGQATMANSAPVVVASNQTAVPVSYATTGSGTATGALRVELSTNGTGVVGLNAGTNAIGKLAANSGVDIGDVDILSIAAGDNNIGNVDIVTLPVAFNTGTRSATTQRVSVATDDVVQTTPSAPTTIYNGKKAVTTAGTRVTLAASQAVKSVVIKALAANTGIIYVGDASVASTNGFALAAGEIVSLDIANLNTVNLDSSVNGESVTYIGTN